LNNYLRMNTELQSKVFKLWIQRKSVVAKYFTQTLVTNPMRDLRIRKTWAAHTKNVFVLFTPEEAFSLYIETHLIKKALYKNSNSSKSEELRYLPTLLRN